MPIKNTFDQENKLVYSICHGVMTEQDFVEYIEAAWSGMEHYGFNELFDTTEADWSQFDFSFLFKVAENASKLSTLDPNSRLAWVVLEGKQKELTDFYKEVKAITTNRSRELKAFYSREDALQWLRQKA